MALLRFYGPSPLSGMGQSRFGSSQLKVYGICESRCKKERRATPDSLPAEGSRTLRALAPLGEGPPRTPLYLPAEALARCGLEGKGICHGISVS